MKKSKVITAIKLFSKRFSKKALAIGLLLCLFYAPITADSEFLVSLFPHFTKPFGEAHDMQYGLGAGVRLTYRPIEYLNLFVQGDYLSMAMPGIDPISIVDGSIGAGYHLRVSDRVTLDFNMNIGAYNAKASNSIAGISAGASIGLSYRINPVISTDISLSGRHYIAGVTPLMMMNAAVSPGITFNITQIFNSSTNVDMKVKELVPVFPVLYSWYENNSFGNVEIFNEEDTDITDVVVSFYQPQYMAHAKECGEVNRIKKGESASFDLYSFFNEQILELTEKTDTNSFVIVNYAYLGQKRTKTFSMDVPVYGRNNMSWDDDRRAAVFVSSKDPAAMKFAKYAASIVRENLRYDVPINIQYAIGIFEALDEFGLNYVVDPSSAFADNIGTSAIDFLQFPYQTLMYKGGDCDDISILVCSLFEAVGIRTAFITIPGHIFMAFDSGMNYEHAQETLKNIADFIVVDDEVWVPLEITLSDEGFYKACRVGAREWRAADYQGSAMLYKMSDSWKLYQPISVPGANANINMPDDKTLLLAFETSINKWSKESLRSYLDDQSVIVTIRLKNEPDKVVELETVLREDPLATQTLIDVLSSIGIAVAIAPAPLKEERDDDYDDDEDIDDLIPLEYAIAKLQSDVNVKDRKQEEAAEGPATTVAAGVNTEAAGTTVVATGTNTGVADATNVVPGTKAVVPGTNTVAVDAKTGVPETKRGVPELVEGQITTSIASTSTYTGVSEPIEEQNAEDAIAKLQESVFSVEELKQLTSGTPGKAVAKKTETTSRPSTSSGTASVATGTTSVTKETTKTTTAGAAKTATGTTSVATATSSVAAGATSAAVGVTTSVAAGTASAVTGATSTAAATTTAAVGTTSAIAGSTTGAAVAKTEGSAVTTGDTRTTIAAPETKIGVPEPVEGQITKADTTELPEKLNRVPEEAIEVPENSIAASGKTTADTEVTTAKAGKKHKKEKAKKDKHKKDKTSTKVAEGTSSRPSTSSGTTETATGTAKTAAGTASVATGNADASSGITETVTGNTDTAVGKTGTAKVAKGTTTVTETAGTATETVPDNQIAMDNTTAEEEAVVQENRKKALVALIAIGMLAAASAAGIIIYTLTKKSKREEEEK